jgi:fructan beta-fructosidase
MNRIIAFLCITLLFSSCKNNQSQVSIKEQYRPNFHFTPPAHWMNDPNGLVYYEGEYHLFYQYFPDSTVWGPMHWGHAISKDLCSWEHLPIALFPDSLGLIFSGSAVIDWKNTSGFGKNGIPPMIAIFTQHDMAGEKAGKTDFQYQSIAYSNDKGRTWTKYAGNPVIPNINKIKDFRDPKMLWDEIHQQWTMVFAAHDHIMIWASKDLKNWKHQSDFGKEYGSHRGVWECPDLFPIQVEGTKDMKWILLQSINPGSANGGSGTQYFVGDFDGKNFTLDKDFKENVLKNNAVWLDWGRDNYAGVTWSDIPKSDGRRLFLGWMSNWDYAQIVPTVAWRSAMTLPRQLILKKTTSGYKIFSSPAVELQKLRKEKLTIDNLYVDNELDINKLSNKITPNALEIELEIAPDKIEDFDFHFELSNDSSDVYKIGYEGKNNQFYSNRINAGIKDFSDKFAAKIHAAPRFSNTNPIILHLFLDESSCELFADDGSVVMTEIFFPHSPFNHLKLKSNQKIKVLKGNFYNLGR